MGHVETMLDIHSLEDFVNKSCNDILGNKNFDDMTAKEKCFYLTVENAIKLGYFFAMKQISERELDKSSADFVISKLQ